VAPVVLDTVLGWFSTDLGIDLGTCNTLVCVRGQGVVISEPSVVAVKKGTNQVLQNGNAVGLCAKEMIGKTPGSIQAVRPMKEGVIADFTITEAMINYFIRRVTNGFRLVKPRLVIAIPSGITAVERRAVYNSAERAGARKVYLVLEPMAAAIGAGLPVAEPRASMIVDIGGGTTEVAIISLADIVASNSLRVGGDKFDEAVAAHMKRTYNLVIGEQTAERIKIQIGSASAVDREASMEVCGRDVITGRPRKAQITSEEVREALSEPVGAIAEAVSRTLERADPELAADLVDSGITVAGGSSLLCGLDQVLANATGLTVRRAEDPLTCVARGLSVYLENLDMWKDTLENEEDAL
jgi:rod shape-determining protein MreB